jgi:hypothetical protein
MLDAIARERPWLLLPRTPAPLSPEDEEAERVESIQDARTDAAIDHEKDTTT